MLSDFDLLQDFAERGSEEAFRTLVERHVAMVHGVALRAVQDAHRADDVTQAVFILLARKASRLRRGRILAGWLYRTTRFVAMEAVRAERRRQQHLEDFARMNATSSTSPLWEQLAPLLDEVMARLGDIDRNAIVLRFLEERSFADVGNALGTSEAAAKMRVGRALDKLRSAFARRGVVVPTAALLATLSAHSASAAPVGFSTTVTSIALSKGAAVNPSLAVLVKAALKLMAWQKIKTIATMSAVTLLLAGGALLIEQRGRQSASTPLFVAGSLDPLAGEWEGTFVRSGGGAPENTQRATLSVRTSRAGHFCEIDMRAFDAAGRASASYRFAHTLDQSATTINTSDDPQIARMSGEGTVAESFADAQSVEWRLAFRTPRADGGYSDCRMVRKGNELTTIRSDWIAGPQGLSQLTTELKMRRRAGGKASQ